MAVSGIDHTIKIFSPDARDQRNARKGIGVQSSDPGSFSSLGWGRRRRTRAEDDETDEHTAEALSDSDEEVASNGLRSRKRMHEAYQITSQNDMDRKGGREDYFISVSRREFFWKMHANVENSKRSLRNLLDILLRLSMVEGVKMVILLFLLKRTALLCRMCIQVFWRLSCDWIWLAGMMAGVSAKADCRR
jgi:hypothetical protein